MKIIRIITYSILGLFVLGCVFALGYTTAPKYQAQELTIYSTYIADNSTNPNDWNYGATLDHISDNGTWLYTNYYTNANPIFKNKIPSKCSFVICLGGKDYWISVK